MKWLVLASAIWLLPLGLQKIEEGPVPKTYRILSVSESAKLVLISDLKTKQRSLLDASHAKIIINGKESELKHIQDYSIAQVEFQRNRKQHDGVKLDGTAILIRINTQK